MNKYRFLIMLCLIVVPAAVSSCSGGGGGSAPGIDGNLVSDASTTLPPTAAGIPIGAPVSKVIGAQGGFLESPDHHLTVTFPASALTTSTTITLQPITNTAHGGVGNGYRLEPDGITFPAQASVTLTFQYSDSEVLDNSDTPIPVPELLGVDTQDAQGYWSPVGEVVIDTTGRTVSVQTTHFTEFAKRFGIVYAKNRLVKAGQNANFSYYAKGFQDRLVKVGPWKVQTVVGGSSVYGTFARIPDERDRLFIGRYQAPAKFPPRNPVDLEVAVELKKADGTPLRFVLPTTVTIVTDYFGWIFETVTVGEARFEYSLPSMIFRSTGLPTFYTMSREIPDATLIVTTPQCGMQTYQLLAEDGTMTLHVETDDPDYGKYSLDYIDVIATSQMVCCGTVCTSCNGCVRARLGTRCDESGTMESTDDIGFLHGTKTKVCVSLQNAQISWQLSQVSN